MNAKRMRDYAFRQLRRHAAIVERNCQRAADRADSSRGFLGTQEFWLAQAAATAETARKIAVEYSAFINNGSYI